MRPRTPTGQAPRRPAAPSAPSVSREEAIAEVAQRLRQAQGQVAMMIAQLDHITTLLRQAQDAPSARPAPRSTSPTPAYRARPLKDPRRDPRA